MIIKTLIATACVSTVLATGHSPASDPRPARLPKQGYAITKHYANPHDPMIIDHLLRRLEELN